MLFSVLFEQFLESLTLDPKSVKYYSFIAHQCFLSKLASLDIENITPELISEISNLIESMNLTEQRKKEGQRLLKRTFRYAVQENLITQNPCALIISVNNDSEFSYPQNIEEHKKLIDAFEKIPLRNLFGFCYYTGISIRKAITIDLYTVDLEAKTFQLESHAHEGIIPIPEQAMQYVLAAMNHIRELDEVENHRLFVRPDGKHIGIPDIVSCTHMLRVILDKPNFKSRTICRCHHNITKLTGGNL